MSNASKGNPVPDDLVKMLAKPGKYLIPLDAYGIKKLMVEVDESRKVHQLKLDGVTRDGEMSIDGWEVGSDMEFKAYRILHMLDGRPTIAVRVGMEGMAVAAGVLKGDAS